MSGIRKFAGLPDLDFAPDVYETPELTDDNSTYPTSTTLRSDSPTSPASPLVEADNGIDRHNIDQDEARTRFLSSHERDYASRSIISDKRKSHKSTKQRHRKDGEDIINEIDVSGSEDEESLERQIVRLRREVSEVQNELQKQELGEKATATAEKTEIKDMFTILDAVSSSEMLRSPSSATRFLQQIESRSRPGDTYMSSNKSEFKASSTGPNDYNQLQNGDSDSDFTIADFDGRLKSLEEALGLQSLAVGSEGQAPTKPVLPSLEFLDKQLKILSTSSESSIDKLKGRIRELAREAETLEHNRIQARKALESLNPSDNAHRSLPSRPVPVEGAMVEDAEQSAKINALYGTLDTIESLAPLLPSVLDRLRSLQDLHANAANASQSLAAIEQRQEDVKGEIQNWRDGLEKVEKAVGENQEAAKDNTSLIEGWVRELVERMSNLG